MNFEPSRSTQSSPSKSILTLSFYFLRVSSPHYLPHVLLYLEGSPLGPLGLLLVEEGHHCPHLEAVEDARAGLRPVQRPGCCGRTRRPRGTAGGPLGTAVVAAAEPGCTHLHCIATRTPRRITGVWEDARMPVR